MKLTICIEGTPEEAANGLQDLGFSLVKVQNQLVSDPSQVRIVSRPPESLQSRSEAEMRSELERLRRDYLSKPHKESSPRSWEAYDILRAKRDELVQEMMSCGYVIRHRRVG